MPDPLVTLGKVFLVFFFVFLNAFFVAAEFAIVKIRGSRLNALAQTGDRQAIQAQKLITHIETALSVTQLGITLASLGLGWIGEPAVAALLHPFFCTIGMSPTLSEPLSFFIAFSLITALHIILGELIPKNLAIRQTEPVLLRTALPLLIFQRAVSPFVWLLNHIADGIAERIGIRTDSDITPAHTEDELLLLMAESQRHGYINQTELDFVDNIFEFSDRTAREIMIPRTDMICLYLQDSWETNRETILQTPPTRYPICQRDKDTILGFLHIKDLLTAMHSDQIPDLKQLTRSLLVVPENMPVHRLLKTMQQKKLQMAIVVDEFGGTAGMVTLEDIVEEIVGEIYDEFDQESLSVEPLGNGLYSVDARLPLIELSSTLGLSLSADASIDTLGGWLYAQIETPPVPGQKASCADADFFIKETDAFRIRRILIQKNTHQ